MIQRPQTVYLILGAVLVVFSLFVNLGNILGLDQVYTLSAICAPAEIPVLKGHWFFLTNIITVSLAVVLAIYSVSQFKNRPKQLKLVYLLFFAVLAQVVNVLYTPTKMMELLSEGVVFKESFGTYLPIAAVAFCILALKGIRKDEELVKSIDRIR